MGIVLVKNSDASSVRNTSLPARSAMGMRSRDACPSDGSQPRDPERKASGGGQELSAGRPVKSLDPALDIVRLLAALLVAVGHLRALAIPDMDPSWGFFAKLAYATTTLGHAAVMVFFVLSGYLVGGKVIDDTIQGTFSWTVYLISRYVRLAIVLVPAVVMTVILDQAGMWIFETGNYSDGGVVDNRTSLVALLREPSISARKSS
ncbi:MAG: acyltransferase [Kineosporiaceae bacterium]|nr:acyltransferase [Kineosporiaceae bacterium]